VIALDPGTITTIQRVGFLDSGIRFISAAMELDYGGGVPACWRLERGGGVVCELRRGDVVQVVYLLRAGNNWSGGSAVRRTAAEKNFDGERR
jgi:hypothetical protein